MRAGWLYIGLGALAIAAGAQIAIPMVPVPMTLQTLAVVAGGLVLGPKRGALAAAAYLGLVVLGLPVLAEGESAGGMAFLELKSAGYVVGFVPGAFAAGWLGRRPRPSWKKDLAAGLLGHVVVLAFGVSVLAGWIGVPLALEHGLVPFLPGVLVKSALAAGIAHGVRAVR